MEKVARAFAEQAGYIFRERIGVGAFKETFLVSDPSGPYALKVLGPNCSTTRTEREIDALLRCSHENIAKLLRVVEFQLQGETHKCLVEEYLGGGTLGDRLKKGLQTLDAVKKLGAGVIRALQHLHGLELVHRDIKPENVMYKSPESNSPIIVDFGLVRDLTATSITQTWFSQGPGTPLFASPEQLNNRKELIDWRSDQFSLGVTLTFALFGFHPYSTETDSAYECIDRVASWQEPSSRFRETVQRAGIPLLEQMVRPYPVQRVRTPDQLLMNWDLT